MKLNENKFIDLLRKSDDFVINEAFSKVKNAKVLAIYSDVKSVIFQNPKDRKIYYSTYKLNEDTIELTDIEKFEFEKQDQKEVLKENINNLFNEDYEKGYKNFAKSIKEIITEEIEPEIKIKRRIDELLREEVIVHIDKPKYKIKDASKLKESLEKLREHKFFGKFLVESENKAKTPVILESVNWEKDSGKIFRKKVNYDTKVKSLNESKYTLRGLKKTQILAKDYWKDNNFRKHIVELLEDKTKPEVFFEKYKNITLLEKEELNEMLSKALLYVLKSNKIDESLNKILEGIKANKNKMLHWGLLLEQPPMAGDPAPVMGTPAGDLPPEAMDVSGEAGGEEAGSGDLGVSPDEIPEPDAAAELGAEEDLATEATEEVKIINALLEVIEDVFWNGNQENQELANLIKEIRDMRASGSFDEDRLTEIFRDLFAITQQIGTSAEEESPVGEEVPSEEGEVPEEPGAEAEMVAPEEAPEETPLETYA